MSDRREEILKKEYFKYYRDSFPTDEKTHEVVNLALCIKEETQAIKNAMDEYMKECVLLAFEFVAHETTAHCINEKTGLVEFKYKGEWITREQLFKNFL